MSALLSGTIDRSIDLYQPIEICGEATKQEVISYLSNAFMYQNQI
jgi:hypothetical protein